jgi:GAF domain-containing protein
LVYRFFAMIGILIVSRATVQPFDDKHIALLTTFADQAVIAIENTRLFEAEQQRTRELAESLQQQTATSEVLQVISRSPGDLQPVFENMLENAVRICDAKFGNIYLRDGDALRIVAALNTPAAFADQRRRVPFRPSPINPVGQMIRSKMPVHIPDVAASEAYAAGDPVAVASVNLAGLHTFLTVPLLKESEIVGAFTLGRQEVRPFTDKQITLGSRTSPLRPSSPSRMRGC